MRTHSLIVFGLFLVPAGRAADPPPTFHVTVRDAVAGRKLQDSALKGSAKAGTPFREVNRDGGVLVGLEVGLGRTDAGEYVRCIRPVYRLGKRDWPGPAAGDFVSDQVTRTVRAVARDGFVAGGVWVNAGGRIDGISLVYHRLKGGRIDPDHTYQSEWLGNGKADQIELLDGKGRPAVGLFARTDAGIVHGLGLTFALLPPPATAATARPAAEAGGARGPSALEADAPSKTGESSAGLGWGPAALIVLLGIAGVVVPVAVVAIRKRRRQPGRLVPAALSALRPVSALGSVQLGEPVGPSVDPTSSGWARDLWLPPAAPAASRTGLFGDDGRSAGPAGHNLNDPR